MENTVSFQFFYRKYQNDELGDEFISNKNNIIDAMQDFLSSIPQEIFDADYEVKVDYGNGEKNMITVDIRQDWDRSFYFVYDNKMICRNDIKPYNN